MTHPILTRIFMLDHVADERFREHQRRSTSAAAIAGIFAAFVLLEYHLLIEHRILWELIAVIYAMGLVKSALMLWYRSRN